MDKNNEYTLDKILIINFVDCLFERFFSFFYLNNFRCLKVLEVSRAIVLPSLVREKEVLGSPVINFLFRRVLMGRSSFRESGHSGS